MLTTEEADGIMKLHRVFTSKKAIMMLIKLYEFKEPLNIHRLAKFITKGENITGITWYNAMNILKQGGYVKMRIEKFSKIKSYMITERGIKLVEFLEEMTKL